MGQAVDARDRTLNLPGLVAGQTPGRPGAVAHPYLELRGLSKRFGDTVAVDDLSLRVGSGEFVSLLGPSGCGKTTTLQMIAGFVEPTSGAVTLNGQDLLRVPPRARGLGIVFQSYALFPHMTVAGNVAFGLEMRRLPRQEREIRVGEALALVGLEPYAARLPRQLSGGQQQRVALARALVIRPSLLLLDEPLSNLDARLREEMRDELRAIQRQTGATTILVTHDQAEAMALSDRIVVMNRGHAEQIASPQEVYARPATPFVARFLGRINLLEGTTRREGGLSRLEIGDACWTLPCVGSGDGGDGPVTAAVRPERVAFAQASEAGLSGRVHTRVFLGREWLLHVETACGEMTVVTPNLGSGQPGEGDLVRLRWNAADMTITRVPGAAP
jgi:putative spermidine/putrescine transport system ATP-binding protein